MKKQLAFLAIPFILALIVIGCAKFEITNPFYVKDGVWNDPFTLSAIHEEGDSSAVRLDWGRPDLASIDNYRIYRSEGDTNSFGKEPIAIIAGDTHTYLDTAVVSGKTYFYKMSLISGGKESRHSSVTAGIIPVKHVGIIEVTHKNAVLTEQNAPSFTFVGYQEVTLIIANRGTAPVSLKSLDKSTDWITVSGYESKALAPDSSMKITVGIDWNHSALETSTKAYAGTITIATSLASAITIPVSALKMSNIGVINVTNSTEELDFANSKSNITLKLNNSGDATVETCHITTTTNWISPKDTTISAIEKGKDANLLFTINRELLPEGENTKATLLIDYGIGTKLVTLTASKSATPKLAVTQGSVEITDETNVLDFATNLDTLALTVKNSGTGTLVLGKPTLGSGNWFSIDASWNDTTRLGSDSSKTLRLICDRSKLAVGENLSTITIAGTKGETVTAKVRAQRIDTESPLLRVSVNGDSLAETIALETGTTSKVVELKNVGGSPLTLIRPKTEETWLSITGTWGDGDTITIAPDETRNLTLTGDTSKVEFDTPKKTTIAFVTTNGQTISRQVTLTKPSTTADKVPARIDSAATTYKSITIKWDSSKVASFTEYQIYRHTDNSVSNKSTKVATISNKHTLTFTDTDPSLKSNTQYFYRVYVVANNLPNNAVGSDIVSMTTLPARVVKGIVTNRNGGKPIDGAYVVLSVNGKTYTDTAGSDGSFEFKNPDSGAATITVTKTNTDTTYYLTDGVSTTIKGVDSVTAEPKMTVVGVSYAKSDNSNLAVMTALGASKGTIYGYEDESGFNMSTFTTTSAPFLYDPLPLSMITQENDTKAFDLVQSGKNFYFPSAVSMGLTREGFIGHVDETGVVSKRPCKGVPYALAELSDFAIIIEKYGHEGNGAIRIFSKDETDYSGAHLGVFDFAGKSITIGDNLETSRESFNALRPLMTIEGNTLIMTTGTDGSNKIVKFDISKRPAIDYVDMVNYPNNAPFLDMKLINGTLYATDGSKFLYILNADLELEKTIEFTEPIEQLIYADATNSAFSDYLIVQPIYDGNLKSTASYSYFVSLSQRTIAASIHLTGTGSSAVQFNKEKIAVATTDDGQMFAKFNVIQIVE